MPGEKTVDISIGARLDRLDNALREAFTKFERFDRAIQAREQKQEAAFSGRFKLGEQLGNLAKGVVTIEALRGGLDFLATAARESQNGMEGLVKALEKLPFGIGASVGFFRDFLGEITGINEQIRNFEKYAKEMEAFNDAMNKARKASGGEVKHFRDAQREPASGPMDTVFQKQEQERNRLQNYLDNWNETRKDVLSKVSVAQVGIDDPRVLKAGQDVRDRMGNGRNRVEVAAITAAAQRAMEAKQAELQQQMLQQQKGIVDQQLKNQKQQVIAEAQKAIGAIGYFETNKYLDSVMAEADKAGRETLKDEEQKRAQREEAMNRRIEQERAAEWNLMQTAEGRARSNITAMERAPRTAPTVAGSANYFGFERVDRGQNQADLQRQQVDLQKEANRIAEEMREELKRRNDYIATGDPEFLRS